MRRWAHIRKNLTVDTSTPARRAQIHKHGLLMVSTAMGFWSNSVFTETVPENVTFFFAGCDGPCACSWDHDGVLMDAKKEFKKNVHGPKLGRSVAGQQLVKQQLLVY